jgi:UDP-glucose 4-epimerase
MKILVTGGAGFIASHIVDALVSKNHEVAIIDDMSNGQEENINPKAKFFKVDISNAEDVKKVFDEFAPEVIFHLAAQANVRKSIENPERDREVNVIGTLNLLENAARAKTKHFIFSSTGGAIYGENAPRPTPETEEPKPVSPYGRHKLESEINIARFAKENGFKATILRYANVYGPKQNPRGEAGVIAIFADKMIANEPLSMFGSGDQTRDYVFVKDIVSANLKALESGIEGTFNIGTGKEISLKQIVESLERICGKTVEVEHLPAIEGELMASCLDASLARQTLDWKVEYQIEEGLEQTINYLQNASN